MRTENVTCPACKGCGGHFVQRPYFQWVRCGQCSGYGYLTLALDTATFPGVRFPAELEWV
jgi:DnaJ-class molecular chaperone